MRLKIDLRGTSDGYFRFSFVGRHHGCTTRSRCSLKSHNIERVSRGEIWANCIETEYLLEAARNAPSCDGIDSDKVSMLSKREVQVAEGAAQGYCRSSSTRPATCSAPKSKAETLADDLIRHNPRLVSFAPG